MFLDTFTNLSVLELVKFYHSLKPKLKYKEICSTINEHYHRLITMDMVKRICKEENLSRRRNISDSDLKDVIVNELKTSMSKVGYRQMWEQISLKYDVNVSKECVRKILKAVDPKGVEERRSKTIKRRIYWSNGPGDIFHIDGNDKLKRWGFCIHGCIDGFSRKIIWLNVASSNNDPLIIANFFLSSIKKLKFVPSLLRMDKGRENIYCEDLQTFFTGSNESFFYAASVRNQRIEALWSRVKKFRTSLWIDFFQSMTSQQLFKPSLIAHQECLLFCFLPILQQELNIFMQTWNLRQVRQSSHAPGGKPDVLFYAPETVKFKQQGVPVTDEDIDIVSRTLGIRSFPTYKDNDFHELLHCYVNIHKIKVATCAEEALDMYVTLLGCLQNDLFTV